MLYCEECRLVFRDEKCIACGRKKAREVMPEDLVFLINKESLWSSMVEDVLRQNNIKYSAKSDIGIAIALKVGSAFERFRFYVPYKDLAEAEDLMAELFSELVEEEEN